MDPLSIVGTVAGLTATCVQTAKKLHDLKGKYDLANVTIAAISTEACIISASLSRIQSSMLIGQEEFATKLRQSNLTSTLDTALTGCCTVFDVLESEIDKCLGPAGEEVKFRDRVKIVWNEGMMQDLLGQLRGLQSALTLLLQLLATDDLAEVRRMMDANAVVLAQLVARTRKGRPGKSTDDTQSIFNRSYMTTSIWRSDGFSTMSDTTFGFDNEIISSQAYRRVIARAYAAIEAQPPPDSQAVPLQLPQDHLEDDLQAQAEGSASSMATAFAAQPLSSTTDQVDHTDELSETVTESDRSIRKALGSKINDIAYWQEWAGYWNMSTSSMKGMPRNKVERQFVIHEMIQSEVLYLSRLLVFNRLYRDGCPPVWGGSELFPDCMKVFNTNGTLLLEPILDRQRSQGPWISSFADVFVSWATVAKPFYVKFTKDYINSQARISRLEIAGWDFRKWLDENRNNPISARLDYSSYIKSPLNRLERYTRFLEVILKLTVDIGEDLTEEADTLKSAIQAIRALWKECDAVVIEERLRAEIRRIQERIQDSRVIPPNAVILFHKELKLKPERTFESSTPVELLIYKKANGKTSQLVFKQIFARGSHIPRLQLIHKIKEPIGDTAGPSITELVHLGDRGEYVRLSGFTKESRRELYHATEATRNHGHVQLGIEIA